MAEATCSLCCLQQPNMKTTTKIISVSSDHILNTCAIETDRVASGERIILQRFLFEAVCHTLGGFSLAVFVCHTCIKMTGDIHGKWLQDHQNDTKFRFYLFSTSAMSTVVLFITCWLKKIVPIRRAASLPFNPLASLVLS